MKNNLLEIATLMSFGLAVCDCDAMLNIARQEPSVEKHFILQNIQEENISNAALSNNKNNLPQHGMFSALQSNVIFFKNIIWGKNPDKFPQYISKDSLLQTINECLNSKSVLDSLYTEILQNDSLFNAVEQQLINPCHPAMESLFSNCFYEIASLAMEISCSCYINASHSQFVFRWEEKEYVFYRFWNEYYGKLAHLLNSSVASPDKHFSLCALKRDFEQTVEDYLMEYLTNSVIVGAKLNPILFSSPLSDTFLMENVTAMKNCAFVQVLTMNRRLLENFYMWQKIAILYAAELDFIEQPAPEIKNKDRLKVIAQTLKDIAYLVFELDLSTSEISEDHAFFKSGLYNIWSRTRNLIGMMNGLVA
ncbi:MAG: hypothetical protein LBB21_05825 [Holosporaceae bacterium]|jgi:hypothetical protein|nr:hypothetical protein [Holosporaceae bacterium]